MKSRNEFSMSLQVIYAVTKKTIEILERMINDNRILTSEEVEGINKDNAIFRSLLTFYDKIGGQRQPNVMHDFLNGKELIASVREMDRLIKLYNNYTLGPKISVLIDD